MSCVNYWKVEVLIVWVLFGGYNVVCFCICKVDNLFVVGLFVVGFIYREILMFIINVEVCKEQGKGVSCCLCVVNKFLVIIYGGEVVLVVIELDYDKVWNMQDKVEFYSEVLIVVVDGKEEKVKVQVVQCYVFKLKLIYIDFVCV